MIWREIDADTSTMWVSSGAVIRYIDSNGGESPSSSMVFVPMAYEDWKELWHT